MDIANGCDPVGVRAAPGNETGIAQARFQRRACQVESAPRLDLLPQVAHDGRIASGEVVDEALEVRCLRNIHRRAGGRHRLRGLSHSIPAALEEFVEHVVFIGRDDQAPDRQSHLLRDMARQHVAEVSRRHCERHLFVFVCRGREIALEVVDDLRRNPRPVDRVDGADAIFPLERGIGADGLDQVLAIVEHAADRDVENVGVGKREHLRGLKRAHFPQGREHEHGDAALAPHRVFCSGTGVARRRADNVERRALPPQHVLEQIAEQLHRDILERQRRAVRDAQQIETVVQFSQRGDVFAAEIGLGIGTIDQRLQVGRGNIGEVSRQDRQCQLAVVERAKRIELGRREARIAFRHRQPAVRRQSFEQDRRERLWRSVTEARAAGADVVHYSAFPKCATSVAFG